MLYEMFGKDGRRCCGKGLELVLLVRIAKVRDAPDYEPRNARTSASRSETVALHVEDFDFIVDALDLTESCCGPQEQFATAYRGGHVDANRVRDRFLVL